MKKKRQREEEPARADGGIAPILSRYFCCFGKLKKETHLTISKCISMKSLAANIDEMRSIERRESGRATAPRRANGTEPYRLINGRMCRLREETTTTRSHMKSCAKCSRFVEIINTSLSRSRLWTGKYSLQLDYSSKFRFITKQFSCLLCSMRW